MSVREIIFPPQDEPLRSDVSFLGGLVGEVIREQGGEALFARVEEARRAAIARREVAGESEEELSGILEGLTAAEAEELVQAFSTYFLVVNLAEKVHRIRRRRDYQRASGPQAGSLEATLLGLREAGADLPEVLALLERLEIEPVFTAHPTEATRRAILDKEQRLALQLIGRLDPTLTPPEERRSRVRIHSEISSAWQTEEQPEVRPTVGEEREHVLFFLGDILYRVIPPFYEELERAVEVVYGSDQLVVLPTIVRFASWVGGDMDGNPNVGADTLLESLEQHRQVILQRYRREVEELAEQLTQSARRAGVDAELLQTAESYARRFPEAAATIPPRHRDMPYRIFLRFVGHRLEATLHDRPQSYPGPADLLADLRRVASSLERHRGKHAGLFAVRRLARRIETFGFHLAAVDVRQDSLVHREVLAELLGEERWAGWPAGKRCELLRFHLESGRGAPGRAVSDTAKRTLAVFSALVEARRRFGSRAIGPYIVSMAQDVDDVLSVLLLARWSGLEESAAGIPLDVAPLFETVPDLEAAPGVVASLVGDSLYRRHLERRRHCQVVMIGYSDSSKDGGIAASRWALQQAQASMLEKVAGSGIGLTFFHGRGGTVGRGGGKTHRAILAAPSGSVAGRLRMTEQGEVIDDKYGLRGIAMRELERTAGSVLVATAREQKLVPDEKGPEGSPHGGRTGPPAAWQEAMTLLARESRRAYRALVYEDGRFAPYFRSATPIDVIERLRIGSRPSARRSRVGVENLRAIPWVFAWTQNRHFLPAWFGLGSGIDAARSAVGGELLADMSRQWPFLQCLLDDAEMALAKTDLGIAARYARLAPGDARAVFDIVSQEYERTRRGVLRLKRARELLEGDRVVARSIRLRNPYVDPMSLLQVDLLRRWRQGDRQDDALLRALLATVHGIAQGLWNTG